MKKQCTKCGNWYPATTKFFHKRLASADNLTFKCKNCRSEERKARYAKNGEIEREQMRQYAAEHRVEAVERVMEWKKNNPLFRKANDRKYRQNHKEQGRRHVENRRARLASAEGQYTEKDIKRLYKKQRGKCAYCDVSLKGGYDIDHIVPLSRGGSNWPDNLALACPTCNRSKRDRLVSEWKS